MGGRIRGVLIHKPGGLELCLITLLAAAVFLFHLPNILHTPDESDWIATSQFYEAFTQGEFPPEAWHAVWGWQETYWTLTQPPVARYLIAIGRRAGGYAVRDLNTPWNWALDVQGNIEAGKMPTPRLLFWSRLPMALLTAFSVGLLFALAGALSGRLGAYALAGLLLTSAYLRETALRALGEAPLLFFVLVCTVFTAAGLQSWLRAAEAENASLRRAYLWFALAGIAAGLAAASKLNGLLAAGGAAAAALWAAFFWRGSISPTRARTFALRIVPLVSLLAMGTLIALYPFLHSDPLTRLGRMYKFRLQEMQVQTEGFPQDTLSTPLEQIGAAAVHVLSSDAAFRFPGAALLNGALITLGAAGLLRGLFGRKAGESAAALAARLGLLGVLGPMVAAACFSPLNWGRYYLFPVLLGLMCTALGLHRLLEWAAARVR